MSIAIATTDKTINFYFYDIGKTVTLQLNIDRLRVQEAFGLGEETFKQTPPSASDVC
jgi:hypothetical protein